MKKICVVTTTRADYGLLYPLIKRLSEHTCFELQLIVSGTHLSEKFGKTVNEIYEDKIAIAKKINILTDAKETMSEIFSRTAIEFEKGFKELTPDMVIVLGDRFEILAVASVCLFLNIPLAHISGGDLTYGAIDDSCRHAITKLSNLHFTGNEEMKLRVLQMGEARETVFNVGELGVENILNEEIIDFQTLKKSLNFDIELQKYVVVTYHPETLCSESPESQIKKLLKFIKKHDEFKYIITKANIDTGGEVINNCIQEFSMENDNVCYFSSLGRRRYLCAVKNCAFVLGNSSSGIVEAPYLGVPIINIGNRQEGRTQVKNIVNSELNIDSLDTALIKCVDKKFISECKNTEYIYGDGNTSQKIVEIIENYFKKNKITKKKIFNTFIK